MVLGHPRPSAAEYPRPFGNVALLKPLGREDQRTEVYVALRAEGVDRLCVFTLFDPALTSSVLTVDAVRAEASWLVSRVHGNLVQIYDVGQSGDRLFYASEWVEGADLGTLLARSGPEGAGFGPGLAVFMALEIASALHFVRTHEQRATGIGTSFVGLSPSSVIVSREGHVKLLHQGSCLAPSPQLFSERDVARMSLVPPEHAVGGGSEAGDVFVVGALLWQMLTGKPLAEAGVVAHREKLLDGSFVARAPSAAAPAGRGITEGLDKLVLAALAMKPEERPRDLDVLRGELAGILRGLPAVDAAGVSALVGERLGHELTAQTAELARLSGSAAGLLGGGAMPAPTVTLTNFDDQAPAEAPPSAEAPDLELGQIIPGTRYRALSKLGEGGMGAVYAAEHVDIEKKVALKLLHGELVRNPYVLRQFRQEARAASRIGNPYICDVTDWGEVVDGRVFFVMEYLDGPALSKVLKRHRKIPPARAIPILRQVAKALGSAHGKGIVHLDVKPDNVLLVDRNGRSDTVKVVDFGIAGLLGQPGASTRIMGTPEYMAPERAMAKSYDHRSDVYSLGVMAYEMLVGEVPFQASNPLETLAMHVSETPDRLNERSTTKIPEALEALVLRMMDKEPGRRPSSMEEVEALLCEAQMEAGLRTPYDDLPLPAMTAERAARITGYMEPERRRHRLTLVAASAVAAVSVSMAVYFAVREPEFQARHVPNPTASGGGDVRGAVVAAVPSPAPRSLAVAAQSPSGPGGAAPAAPRSPSTASGHNRPAAGPGRAVAAPATRASAARGDEPMEPSLRPAAIDSAAARALVQRGVHAMEGGRIKQAADEFQKATLADPTNGAAWLGLSEVAFQDSRYVDALEHARKAARYAPRAARSHEALGLSAFKLGRYQEALRAYERARALDPRNPGIADEITRVKMKLQMQR